MGLEMQAKLFLYGDWQAEIRLQKYKESNIFRSILVQTKN